MKSFLQNFVKFFENAIMVTKKSSDNCKVGKLDQKLIIIIIYNENTFFINNRHRKIWTLNSQGILQLKRKEKEIMILDFLLL